MKTAAACVSGGEEGAPLRPLLAWSSFAAALALTIPLLWRAWTIMGPNAYQGGDGKALQVLIRTFREFAPVFHINIQNPIQGAAGFANPINVWANPVSWPFLSKDTFFATQASTLIAYVAMALAVFTLACVWRLPIGASITGALASIVVFPPFYLIFGFTTLLGIIPVAAMSAALLMIAAGLAYRVTDVRAKSIVTTALLIALTLGFAIYGDPGWFVGGMFTFLPLFAFCTLDAPSMGVRAGRVVAYALALALLYLVGLVDYVRTLFGYSARLYFYSDWHRPQDWLYASWALFRPELKWTYLLLLIGWTLALVFGNRAARRVALLCVLLFATFLVEAGLFLFAKFDWVGTMPVYYEVLMAPLYGLGAVAGYGAFVVAVWHALPASTGWDRRRLASLFPLLAGTFVFPAVALTFVQVWIYGTSYTPGLVNIANEPWALNAPLTAVLRENLSLKEERRFRGSAYLWPYLSYENQLTLASLWSDVIPTVNNYTGFESPVMSYLYRYRTTWTSVGSSVGVIAQNSWLDPDSRWHNPRMLQALGARYLVEALAPGAAGRGRPREKAVLRLEAPATTVGAVEVGFAVYEYESPNVGNYSPTEVVVVPDAPAALRVLWDDPSFDPRRAVVLTEALAQPLVEATGGEMVFERGAIRVRARSAGSSILLLPLQFSRCLSVQALASGRILRANLVQTAILFSGDLDARIGLGYSIFRTACRKDDLADLPKLGIVHERSAGLFWDRRHPHAISRWADVPDRAKAVLKRLR